MTDVASAGAGVASRWTEARSRVWTDPRRAGIPRFLMTTAQLGLALFLLRALETEPRSGLSRILPLIFIGFVVHAALPRKARVPFCLALSFSAIGLVLGPVAGALVVLVGLALLGICHLPVAFSTRVLLLVIIAGFLAALNTGSIAFPPAVSALTAMPSLPRLVLPVLGSLFMFRLLIYLYELRHEETSRARARKGPVDRIPPASVWMRLSYFFLLPNVCFLLFPIVDFRTYRRTYYDTEAPAIYQRGVWLICLGLAYLLGYRLVYHYLVPSPEEVQGLGGVVRFMTSSYLIYFRVVGQFHLIIGFLCLFGFNLPPAHRYYLLASSFTDFWRRARIEWKDFMVKIFYYPVLVPLQRRLGPMRALVIATIEVFIATWLLHSYQWFWLRGDFRLTRADGVFWVLIGGCVLINSVLEARGARGRPAQLMSFRPALLHVTKILGMIVFMCVLWSYWSSPTLKDWWSVVKAAGNSGPLDYLMLVGGVGLILIGGALVRLRTWSRMGTPGGSADEALLSSPALWWRPAGVLAIAALLLLVRVPTIQGSIGDPLLSVASTLSTDQLNAVDQDRQDRGYYEVLLDGNRSTAGMLAAAGSETGEEPDSADAQADIDAGIDLRPNGAPVVPPLADEALPKTEEAPPAPTRRTTDETKPPTAPENGDKRQAVAGAQTPSNRAATPGGLGAPEVAKDSGGTVAEKPLAEQPPAGLARGTRAFERMLRGNNRATGDALLWEPIPNLNSTFKGIPHRTNQWGMHDREYSLAHPRGTYRIALLGSSITVGSGVTRDQTMESLLEAQLNRDGPGVPSRKYEILNFSVGAYGVLQNVLVAEQKVFRFSPDAVIVGIFSVEVGRMRTYLSQVIKSGYRFDDAYVQNKLIQAGVDSTMADAELIRRLSPISEDLVRWSYRRILEIGRQKNVPVIGIIFPEPQPRYGRDIESSARLAAAAGLPLIDLRGVYDGLNTDSLKLPGNDPHWNVAGNRLVSERVYQILRQRDAQLLKLGSSRVSR